MFQKGGCLPERKEGVTLKGCSVRTLTGAFVGTMSTIYAILFCLDFAFFQNYKDTVGLVAFYFIGLDVILILLFLLTIVSILMKTVNIFGINALFCLLAISVGGFAQRMTTQLENNKVQRSAATPTAVLCVVGTLIMAQTIIYIPLNVLICFALNPEPSEKHIILKEDNFPEIKEKDTKNIPLNKNTNLNCKQPRKISTERNSSIISYHDLECELNGPIRIGNEIKIEIKPPTIRSESQSERTVHNFESSSYLASINSQDEKCMESERK